MALRSTLGRLLGNGLLLRRISRDLQGIREQLTRQTDLLERAYRAQGILAPTPSTEDQADTGISFLDTVEAWIVQDYIVKTEADTGRRPSDEEILTFLADEKTVDLQQRLKQREALALLAERKA